jgi:hypothetical protein
VHGSLPAQRHANSSPSQTTANQLLEKTYVLTTRLLPVCLSNQIFVGVFGIALLADSNHIFKAGAEYMHSLSLGPWRVRNGARDSAAKWKASAKTDHLRDHQAI